MRIIKYCIGIVDAFLALDFLLRAVQASPASAFVFIVERVSSALALPFEGAIRVGNSYHWADVLAIVIYSIAAVLVSRLMRATIGRTRLAAHL
ncbi:MAG TPA: hypothetical protein VJV97_00095 [Gemmatimonadaceae bacterium]|nr:MAG: hypothetical protein E6I55_00055 [Chloroflexota bacterium]HKN57217.1 hypothetical protein [Gemmatimonadaceae bacterium]